jgi:hypothetical protein
MSNNIPEDFRERAFKFTCKLFDFCEDLARTPGPSRQIANQLFDAGSSIGANLEESKAAYSTFGSGCCKNRMNSSRCLRSAYDDYKRNPIRAIGVTMRVER